MIPLLYKGMCPNCGGDIDSERLGKGLFCKKCMDESEDVCEGADKAYKKICKLHETIQKFEDFFEKKSGFKLRSLQKTWAKRFFLDISYALLAPTGIGKTTFGLMLAAFLKPQKSYLLFPTHLLAKSAYERLQSFGIEALFYNSKESQAKKEEKKRKIAKGDFDILITTTPFLYKNIDIIPKNFDFVFMDDVDSVLKSARNIDKVLMLLGFSQEDIQQTLEFITLKAKMARSKRFDQKLYETKLAQIEKIKAKRRGTLLVSSATANPKSKRVLLFRELLGFEVGRPTLSLRNVEDIYEKPHDLKQRAVERLKEFGEGGLLFLPSNATKEELKEFVTFLNDHEIPAMSYENLEKRIEDFRNGTIKVVAGIASYKNPLARGIDLPDVVRYAFFAGVPKLEFTLDLQKHVSLYYFLLALLGAIKEESFYEKALEYINYLKRYLSIPSEKLHPNIQEKIQQIYEGTLSFLTPTIIEKINNSADISLKKEDSFKIVTADVTGYIQASGRVSRLYVGGLTKGMSFLLVDDQKAFRSLQKKVRWFSDDIIFKPVESVDLKELFLQIDEDRKRVKEALEGRFVERKDFFKTALVIVESPNKARTIANFYGKPLVRVLKNIKIYEVSAEEKILNITASKGHLFDLNKEEGYYGVLKKEEFIEVFEPIDESKFDIINALREEDVEVEEVFIATDPDVEGEKISYDLFLNSRPYNPSIKRAEFHEVTKRAFTNALKNPRDFDEARVKAQLVRRVADRWIGFEISQYLQKIFGIKNISAGRVQSAVLEWIVIREKEAQDEVYVVRVSFQGVSSDFLFEERAKAQEFYETLTTIDLIIERQEEKTLYKNPFSTDTMLYESSNRLSFSPQYTMQLAQDLFEAGFITYHRTDSIRVSQAGINVAKEYITTHFGEDLFHPRSFSSSSGAHECIRPTRPMDAKELEEFLRLSLRGGITKDHIKLYDLIFKEFIASQMPPAKVLQVRAKVKALDKEKEITFIKSIVEDGFNFMWPLETHDLKNGQISVEKELFKRSKVPRYTYAQIIKMMKERGIGRPSTYAIAIQKLQERKYIYQKGGVIYATKKGIKVYEILKEKSSLYMFVNEKFTKELEDLMDRVEEGEVDFQEVLLGLYEQIKAIKEGLAL